MLPPGLASLSPIKWEKLIPWTLCLLSLPLRFPSMKTNYLRKGLPPFLQLIMGNTVSFWKRMFQQTFILFQKIHIPDTFIKLERSRIWHFIFISVILFSGTQVECSALGEFIFKRCLGFSVELYQSINMYQTSIFPFFKKRSLISFYDTLVMLIIKKTLIWPFKKKLVYWWEKSSKKIKLDLHFFVMWGQGMNDFINL